MVRKCEEFGFLGDVREHYWILPVSKDVIWNRLYALRWSNLLAVSAARTEYHKKKSWYTVRAWNCRSRDSTQLASLEEFVLARENREIACDRTLYKFPSDDVSREAACNFWARFSEPIRLRYRWLPRALSIGCRDTTARLQTGFSGITFRSLSVHCSYILRRLALAVYQVNKTQIPLTFSYRCARRVELPRVIAIDSQLLQR